MKNRNFKNVFLFTLSCQMRSKGYKGLTAALALLLFLGIAAAMCLSAAFGGGETVSYPAPEFVAVVDNAGGETVELEIFSSLGDENSSSEYVMADSVEAANELCQGKKSFILSLEGVGGACHMNVVLPENAELDADAAEAYTAWLSQLAKVVAMQKAGLDLEQITAVMSEILIPGEPVEDESLDQTDPLAPVREALSYAVPYVTVLLLYFLILFYGQSMSQKVMEEKVSKLMDTFLVSVNARDMVFGKLFAQVVSALCQLAIWIVAGVGGFAVGKLLVKELFPARTLGIITLFESLGAMSDGLFTACGIAACAVMIIAGFVLYSSLAAVGGAMAQKQEDLSSTNTLFSLLLVASFLLAFYNGIMSGEAVPMWLYIFPFTAVLTVPGAVLLGNITLPVAAASVVITVLVSALAAAFAGKAYVLLAFYKGTPMKLSKLIKQLKNK